jgi:hypothetical protein
MGPYAAVRRRQGSEELDIEWRDHPTAGLFLASILSSSSTPQAFKSFAALPPFASTRFLLSLVGSGDKSQRCLQSRQGKYRLPRRQKWDRAIAADDVVDFPCLEKIRPVGQSGPRFGEF